MQVQILAMAVVTRQLTMMNLLLFILEYKWVNCESRDSKLWVHNRMLGHTYCTCTYQKVDNDPGMNFKYTLQKNKRKTTFKKRNAKPHIGDIGKIILIAVWQVTGQRSWSPTVNSVCELRTAWHLLRYSRTYHTAIKIIFPMSPICGFAFLFLMWFCVSFFEEYIIK